MAIVLGDVTTLEELDVEFPHPRSETHWFLLVEGDGSRRIIAQIDNPPTIGTFVGSRLTYITSLTEAHPDYQIIYWGVGIGGPPYTPGVFTSPGTYLPYPDPDTTLAERRPPPQVDPVNQIPDLAEWRGHAATAAHQLDAAMGHHSLRSATEENRLTVFNTFSYMLGSAERRYKEWEAIDPAEKIIGGNFDGTYLWKRNRSDYSNIDDAVCGNCNIAVFAREFLYGGDLPLFRRLHRSGIIYSVDRSLTPWGAQLFDVATQPESVFYEVLEDQYHWLIRHYSKVVGAASTSAPVTSTSFLGRNND